MNFILKHIWLIVLSLDSLLLTSQSIGSPNRLQHQQSVLHSTFSVASVQPQNAVLNITYKIGGRVLINPVKVYYVFYGNWTLSQVNLVKHFTENLGKSAWYKTNTKYYYQATATSPKIYVKPNVQFAGHVIDKYSQGKTEYDVWNIIKSKLDQKVFSYDLNSVYFVLSSPDATNTVFCGKYCAWHNFQDYNNVLLPWAFVILPSNSCGCWSQQKSPNGHPSLESSIDKIAHELVEMVTNPIFNAWEDADFWENADRCDGQYGTTKPSSKKGGNFGGIFNEIIGGREYLIQSKSHSLLH